MKLIVGLGNPGPRYAGTRHNAGFMALDRLARGPAKGGPDFTLTPWRQKFGAEVAELAIRSPGDGQRALLVKPMRFMNCSGQSVQEAVGFYKIEPDDLLVVVDDYALPLGALRLRASGGHGGHNGLRDIDRALGHQNYARLRVGIEPPPPTYSDPADWVLGSFDARELEALAPGLDRASACVLTFVSHGLTKAMNAFNAKA
jgi:PTH1 family peptidyl-tRNA hydrolase